MRNPFRRLVFWAVIFIAVLAIFAGARCWAGDQGDGSSAVGVTEAAPVVESAGGVASPSAAVAGAGEGRTLEIGYLGTVDAAGLLGPVWNALTAKYGWLVAVMAWMVTWRIPAKAAVTWAEHYVRNSPSKEDDKILDEVEASRAWKIFWWIVDAVTSVKLGTQFTAVRGENLSRSEEAGSGPRGATGPTNLPNADQLVKTASPAADSGKGGGNSNGIVTAIGMAFLLVMLCGVAAGCVALKPGADALVVRAEQTETLADSTFGLFLRLDNDQRAFYRTNAPGLHALAEWLREPQVIDGVSYARADAMIVSLNSVKRTYKTSRGTEAGAANSNLLVTAIATISESARQASSWLNVITNHTATPTH